MQAKKPSWTEKGDQMRVKTYLIEIGAALNDMQLYELAKRAGISRTTLSNILNSGRASGKSIVKIANVIGADPEKLIVHEKGDK